MAITLANANVGKADKVDLAVIDLMRRDNFIMEHMIFDDCISPGTAGSTLTYGYLQTKTPATAAKRTINTEYVSQEAIKEKKTADCAIMGGKYSIDRVVIGTAGALDELAYQQAEKAKATANLFTNLVFNGQKAQDGFDGLKVLLGGTENEFTSEIDVSTSALLDTNGQGLLDEIDTLVLSCVEKPDALFMNRQTLAKVRGAARRAGFYERSNNAFGNPVEYYNGIALVDVKEYNGTPIIETDGMGKSAIYAVKFGLDALCGFSVSGGKIFSQYVPDLTLPGAVKDGEIEFVAGVALKNTKTCAVLKDVKVKAGA